MLSHKASLAAFAGILAAFISCPVVAEDDQDDAPSLAEITDAWLNSPHADGSSEAFAHWNEDGEIPGTCAVCHSSTGAIDYVTGPMSTPGVIDHPIATGTTVDCVVCHNSASSNLTSVPFPSGVPIDTFEASAICTVCHQGRAFSGTVESAVNGMEDDIVSGDLSFINVHYAPSAATLMGGIVKGGFEYPDKVYKGQFTHVPDLNTCVDCHNPHALDVSLNQCTSCHKGAEAFEAIRLSPVDFDGDGDTSEGISDPIRTLHTRLGQAIQRYANDVTQAPIVYAIDAYPYFFNDTNADGNADAAEAIFPNRYQSWTPRLLKAAYNYQLVAKDTAIYTHNPHYALQLLFDSIENLGERVDLDASDLMRP